MAKYQFQCSDPVCDYVVEVESPITEPVPLGPPYCFPCAVGPLPKMSRMKRVWNPAAIILRGGGWGKS